MGAYLARPEKGKSHEQGENDFIRFASTSMQGWRTHQEDAHNCITDFGNGCSFFAVYDGHGGSEVSAYLKNNFPAFLKEHKLLQHTTDEGLVVALQKLFVKFDDTLRHDATVKIMTDLKAAANSTPSEQQQQKAVADNGYDQQEETERKEREILLEEAYALSQEANISIEQIIRQYAKCHNKLLERVSEQIFEQQQKPQDNSDSNDDNSDALDNSSISKYERKKRPIMFISPQLHKKIKVQQQSEGEQQQDKDDEKQKIDKNEELMDVRPQPQDKQNNTNDAMNTDNEEATEIPSDPIINKPPETDEATSTLQGNASEEAKDAAGENALSTGKQQQKEYSDNNGVNGLDKRRSAKPDNTENGGKSENVPHSSTAANEVDRNVSTEDEDEEDDPDYMEESAKMDGDETTSSEEAENEEETVETEEEPGDEEEEEEETEEDLEMLLNSSEGNKAGFDSGSTACVTLLFKDKFVVANIGDSRCVLCRAGKAIELSSDHKPEDLKEKERIEAAGGSVSDDGRVNGGLNLTRAFGDHFYKQTERLPLKDQMITALPDVTITERNSETDQFLIVACDGIWNSMTSQEACDFVLERLGTNTLKEIGADMCDHCCAKDTSGDGSGCDNETVILIDLKKTTRLDTCATNSAAPEEGALC